MIDYETDILIVGAGTGGCAAGLGAAARDCRVVITGESRINYE